MADQGCARLYSWRPKSVGVGLDCGLYTVHLLRLWHKSATAAVVCGLWRYISVICLYAFAIWSLYNTVHITLVLKCLHPFSFQVDFNIFTIPSKLRIQLFISVYCYDKATYRYIVSANYKQVITTSEKSRVQVLPTALSSAALDKPLKHTCLCHQAV